MKSLDLLRHIHNSSLKSWIMEKKGGEVKQSMDTLFSLDFFIENSIFAILQLLENDDEYCNFIKTRICQESTEKIKEVYNYYQIKDRITRPHVGNYPKKFGIYEKSDLYMIGTYKVIDFPTSIENFISLIGKFGLTKGEEKLSGNLEILVSQMINSKYQYVWDYESIKLLFEFTKINHDRDFLRSFVAKINFVWTEKSLKLIRTEHLDIPISCGKIDISILDKAQFINLINWDEFSQNTLIDWNVNLIDKFSDKLNFTKLCSNKSIRWDYELMLQFEDRLVWKPNNKIEYRHKNTVESRIENEGLLYNSSIFWDTIIFEKWKSKIDIYEISINGKLSTDLMWLMRNELMEKKLHNIEREGPRDDREWVEYYSSGWENIFVNSNEVNISNQILEFLVETHQLHCLLINQERYGRNYAIKEAEMRYSRNFFKNYEIESNDNIKINYSRINLENVLENQYTWVRMLMHSKNNPVNSSSTLPSINHDFWRTCFKKLIHEYFNEFETIINHQVNEDLKNILPKGSIIFKEKSNSKNIFEIDMYVVESDYYGSTKTRLIDFDNNYLNVRDKFTFIPKHDFITNNKYRIVRLDWLTDRNLYFIYNGLDFDTNTELRQKIMQLQSSLDIDLTEFEVLLNDLNF